MDSGGDALIAPDESATIGDELPRHLAQFIANVEPLGVRVERVGTAEAAGQIIARWASDLGAERVVLSDEAAQRAPEIALAIDAAGIATGRSGEPAATRDAPLGVSLARLAVAETGSFLLAEPTLADRAVGMLSLAQVILCPTAALVESLDDAAMELRRIALAPGASFATLVTGPSRTADIERVLTVGVQGPGKVTAIFVNAW